MKPSLRNQYFGWLLVLIVIIYALIIGVFSVIEYHEARTQGTPFVDEVPELLALLVVMLLTVPVALWVAWKVASRLLRPLRQVLQTAEHIRSGHFDQRIPPLPHQDEIAQLAATVNEAFDRYELAMHRIERFSADASHQLRTPLAAIKTSAEVALQKERNSDEYRNTMGEILEQIDRLNETLNQLLLLSRMDRSIRADFAPLSPVALLKEWTETAAEWADDRTIRLETSADLATHELYGNEILLKQCFDNLLNNALAFTQEGDSIVIRLDKPQDGDWIWTVEDSGPGIPEPERSEVFNRFYRGSHSVQHGTGLGLAIVKEIIALHDGTVRAEHSRTLGGAALVICLPG